VIDVPPDPVTMLTATTLGSTANFSWVNPSGDFSHVVIRKGTDTFPTSITDGSLVVTNLAATSYNMVLTDGTHYFSFFVVDRGNNVSQATNVSVTIDTTSPSAPSGFSAIPNSKNITLTWTNPTDPDFVSSTIRRSTTSFPISLTDGDFVTSTSGTTYSDGPLPDGTYYYSIFSADATGNTSLAANATAILTTPEVTISRSGSGPLISIFPSAIRQGNLNFSILNNEASPVSSIVFNPDLKLRLNADPLVVAGYAISLDPTFVNIPIFPLKDNAAFKLPDVFGTYTIYVKYFSTTGQASETLSKTIVYAPAAKNSVAAKNTTSDLFKRTLRIGSRGNNVKALQKFLNQNGFVVALSGPGSPGNETTFFGPSTAKAVSKFQEANNEKILKPYGLKKGTGIFGNTSIKFLDEIYLIK
jgi:hypothetical protein